MNERDLVLDVLAILKSHVTDPFLMGQIARAEDDIDLERPVPDFRSEAHLFADYISCSAFARADHPEQITRRHIYAAVMGALADRELWAVTPPAYDPPEEFTGTAFDRCPDATAQGRRDRCGQFSHIRLCDDTLCALAGEPIAESRAHAPAPADDTTTELGHLDDITYRSTGRGAFDVIRTRAEGPDTVLAMVLFTEGVRGRVHALERFVGSLRRTDQDVQP